MLEFKKKRANKPTATEIPGGIGRITPCSCVGLHPTPGAKRPLGLPFIFFKKVWQIPNQPCCSFQHQKPSTGTEESRCNVRKTACFPVEWQNSGSPDEMEIQVKGCPPRAVPTTTPVTSNLSLASLPCLLLNILLLGGMMLPKQYGHMESPQAVLLSITSQLSLFFSPSTFKYTFFLLAHPSFHSCISKESSNPPGQ